MTLIEYATEVDKQDKLQKKYWKTHDTADLENSKDQEKKVRQLTYEILSPSLFQSSEDEKERIIGKVKEYLEAEPRGITDEYPTFLEELTNVINEA